MKDSSDNLEILREDATYQLLLSEIDKSRLPRHVGIIMDGNGRWAKERGLKRSAGHEAGAIALENLMDVLRDLPLHTISLFSFSTENWSRPSEEVNFLWKLLIRFFWKKYEKINRRNLRIVHTGDFDGLPRSVRHAIKQAIRRSEKNTGTILNFCVNHSGKQNITQAVNHWLQEKITNAGSFEKIVLTEQELDALLMNKDLPQLDLIIRTSGEMRLSNFMIWQAVYAEYWMTQSLWPDFTAIHLLEAVRDYQKRVRRFGGIDGK